MIGKNTFKEIVSDPRHTLLCEKEAATLLGLEVRTMQQRRYRKQKPPYVRIGRNIKYRLSDILNMVAEGEVEPQRGDR